MFKQKEKKTLLDLANEMMAKEKLYADIGHTVLINLPFEMTAEQYRAEIKTMQPNHWIKARSRYAAGPDEYDIRVSSIISLWIES